VVQRGHEQTGADAHPQQLECAVNIEKYKIIRIGLIHQSNLMWCDGRRYSSLPASQMTIYYIQTGRPDCKLIIN